MRAVFKVFSWLFLKKTPFHQGCHSNILCIPQNLPPTFPSNRPINQFYQPLGKVRVWSPPIMKSWPPPSWIQSNDNQFLKLIVNFQRIDKKEVCVNSFIYSTQNQPAFNPNSTQIQPKTNPKPTQIQPKFNPRPTQSQPKFNPNSTLVQPIILSMQRLHPNNPCRWLLFLTTWYVWSASTKIWYWIFSQGQKYRSNVCPTKQNRDCENNQKFKVINSKET